MSFCVYVLHAVAYDKIYIGFTSDLDSRLLSHNVLSKKGWTIKFRPWTRVHTEYFSAKAEAMKREKEFKSYRGRVFIRKEILKQ